MPCFSPLVGYPRYKPNANGKRPLVFSPTKGYSDIPQQVPCRQCTGCRLAKSAEWAARCTHEASLYDSNCFLTLTYEQDALPSDGSLKQKHYADFMKRFRDKFEGDSSVEVFDKKTGLMKSIRPIRYYHVGEYGDKNRRPHYHSIVFNYDFPDKKFWKMSPSGSPLFLSAELQKLWEFGFSSIGNATFESAAYCARYSLKKINGRMAPDHYRVINPFSGEVIDLKPEYSTMSRRPGVAKRWYDSFKYDIYPHDFVLVAGKKMKPPRFYDSLYELDHPEDYINLKQRRRVNSLKHIDNNSEERLIVRETCAKAKLSLFNRSVE